ncbi:hypothetical protein MASR2M117_19160 [Paludibacter sp.]
MRFVTFLLLFTICFNVNSEILEQENATAPSRTPEQEAAMQTEKMQTELNLSNEQSQAIYEINLRHARDRQVSNSRSQALERVKNKDAQIRDVLTRDQYNRLQDRRYERYPSNIRTSPSSPEIRRVNPTEQRMYQPTDGRVTPSYDRRNEYQLPQRRIPSTNDDRVVRPSQNSSTGRPAEQTNRKATTPQSQPARR